MFSTGNSTVDQMNNFPIEGNVIPTHWFNIFKLDNGKPDVNAVILLSEIVYWYRPVIVRDEKTGQTIGMKKRFKADFLQRSYNSFSDQFGFTKIQVRDALERLEKAGVITRHFRTILTGNSKSNNVLFIELHPSTLLKLTTLSSFNSIGYEVLNDDPPQLKQDTYGVINGESPQLKVGTNTENTTEITTDIIFSADAAKKPKAEKAISEKPKPDKEKFSFVTALKNLGADPKLITDWLHVRKTKKASNTQTAFDGFVREYKKSGLDLNTVLRICIEQNWKGFDASWSWQGAVASLQTQDSPLPERHMQNPQQQRPVMQLNQRPSSVVAKPMEW
ncbi:MAG: Lrp/AsnC family transcriptional regulator [Acinetobacter populi]|jgi:hypothetical protein|uniref:Lrp/AsnC family transcriptional regulator n=1 Tax=Acinetobacter populi TaxID=1582270 RepID=UPI0023573672|nr:Lrp/AsnC family transcriptional regulator [Acinetobacter populi]MCH4247612.1 Lrp/AsnC family transcriptional regulator [Acinetobacter populi]